jgi:hypothetical protein
MFINTGGLGGSYAPSPPAYGVFLNKLVTLEEEYYYE